MNKYASAIEEAKQGGGSLLDSMHAVQDVDGFMTEAGMRALSAEYGIGLTQIYETASFYSMIRFSPSGKTVIQVFRNAPCHVAGAGKTIAALEKALGIKVGQTTVDGKCTLEYSECIGQCQSSPSLVINGKVHTGVTEDKVPALLKSLF